MSFQSPISIADAIRNIEQRYYLLPAIQREFVWSAEKIEWLFDSLMQGYPISSFLFWSVEKGSTESHRFYEFIRDYRQRFRTHNVEANTAGVRSFTAVLDGQQRLTSLYIGLKGSYAWKEYYRGWNDNEWSIPTRRLYLNIARTLKDQEDDRVYEFSFLKDSDTQQADLYSGEWFRVGKINDLKNFAEFSRYVRSSGMSDSSGEILAKLHEMVFTTPSINYFEEREQNLDKALNIFIRINSGGQPLDFSDLIMSVAVANWTKDARKEIHRLVDRTQEIGFSISKDFIFKSYLYLYSSDIRFKATNFSKDNAANFEQDWEGIRDAIEATFELVRSFGYTDYTLTSKNAVIPILYYIYHRGICHEINTRIRHREDRDVIRKWLHVVLLKRVLGAGGGDSTLTQIRRAFTEDIESNPKIDAKMECFPADAIKAQIKQDLSVGVEFVEELLKTPKDDRYAFCILALLYPYLDYANNDFHKDHLHPISCFTEANATTLNLVGADREIFLSRLWNNSIVNLQMLDSNENMSKQDKPLLDWVNEASVNRDRDSFFKRCILPLGESLELRNFGAFAKARHAMLTAKLTELLS